MTAYPERPQLYTQEPTSAKRKHLVSPLSHIAMRGFEGRMWKMMAEVREKRDEDIVTHNRVGVQLIQNDGSKTYLVHSTQPDKLEDIMKGGLKFSGKYKRPEVPDLRHTTIMMAGPKERAAVNRNIHDLAYRYGDEESSIKLVYEFDAKNPGTGLRDDPYAGTYLERADGVNVKRLSAEGEGIYAIPPERLKGYFDLEDGVFVANPQFQSAAAHNAAGLDSAVVQT